MLPRNMLSTTIWLLFVAQSYAKEWAPHAHQQVLNENAENGSPMDYFESVNLPNPHYEISYFYEQKRTNDRPEIDQINEEIGKYMHYQPPKTPTTEPQQNVDEFKEVIDQEPFETPIIVLETHHPNHKHKEATSTLAPMPPAPILREHPHFPIVLPTATGIITPVTQWKEMPYNDVAGSHLDRPEYPAYESTPSPRKHPKHRLHISPITSEAPVEIESQKNLASTEKYSHLSPTSYAPSHQKQNSQNTLAKVNPILDNIKQSSIAPRPVYRGSYKFSWDDINDMHPSIVPKVSLLKENPIPAVPTLSPWYDGYGK